MIGIVFLDSFNDADELVSCLWPIGCESVDRLFQFTHQTSPLLVFVKEGVEWATMQWHAVFDQRGKENVLFFGVMAFVGKLTHELDCFAKQAYINRSAFAYLASEPMQAEHDLQDDLVLTAEHIDCRVIAHGLSPVFARYRLAPQAAFFISSRSQISASASVSSRIISSVCAGPGVKRRRSVPRGTVGKLIGCT